ncbi:MAG: riboflavin synthase [bacterium]
MFSGIIYDIGRVKAIRQGSGVKVLTIALSKEILKAEKGMSIAINGACLTAVSFKGIKEFSSDVTEETLKKTVLKSVKPGDEVNVEFPLTLDKFLSGHLVQGHVDCTGKVAGVEKAGDKIILSISYPAEFGKYIIEKGSITVSGISLTAYNLKNNSFDISIIPETWKNTIVKNLKKGAEVNLEFDIIGKYVENFLSQKKK